jgi:nitroreductase
MAELFDVINTRAMVREYKTEPLKKEARDKILESALRAPTAAGSEQWAFVTVDSDAKRDWLYQLLIDAQMMYFSQMLKKPRPPEQTEKWVKNAQSGIYKAPFYVMVFVDLRERFCTRAEIEEKWAHQSAAAAIENMILAAWAMGIGCCWFGVPLLTDREFYELSGMDKKDVQLAAVLGFGYPKEDVTPRRRRKTLKDVVLSV